MKLANQARRRACPCERDHKTTTTLTVVGLIAFALVSLTAQTSVRAQDTHAASAAPSQPAHQAGAASVEQPHAPTPAQTGVPAQGEAPVEHGAAPEHGAAAEHGAGGEHAAESPWGLVARIFNFAVLAGVLTYVLRTPMGTYLKDRSEQVRRELVEAADLRTAASAQLEEISRRLEALPGEIELLKSRGAQEIAAEEDRIRRAADAERQRLLEQTRREIELQLKVAKRDLQAYAANLAVGVARDRIQKHITADDQLRLVDRYLEQVETKR